MLTEHDWRGGYPVYANGIPSTGALTVDYGPDYTWISDGQKRRLECPDCSRPQHSLHQPTHDLWVSFMAHNKAWGVLALAEDWVRTCVLAPLTNSTRDSISTHVLTQSSASASTPQALLWAMNDTHKS